MNVLGINAYHGDSAAALMVDGRLVAAAEEERFNRIKHWSGFPAQAIAYCLAEAELAVGDLEHVAVNRNPRAAILQRLLYLARKRPSLRLIQDRLKNRAAWGDLVATLEAAFPDAQLRAQMHWVEHHRAHAASAFLLGPFQHAAILSVDGFGDFTSTLLAVGRETDIQELGRVHFPHSLGLFYQAVTQHLGFPSYGDEYKVMGLAPYGEPALLDAMRQLAPDRPGSFALEMAYYRHGREDFGYTWRNQAPSAGRIFTDQADRLLGPARLPAAPIEDLHRNAARSLQARYEEVFLALARQLHAATGADALCIAGGCGANSVANGQVLSQTDFAEVYIPAAPGDAGGAAGAAASIWSELSGGRPEPAAHAYLGPGYGQAEIAALLDRKATELTGAGVQRRRFTAPEALCDTVAEWVAAGLVVGWFQGRMEWGPRALGNRSIICDPRRADMKAILNQKIKRRESFRPFAPSVLREHTGAYFETDYDVPFMSQVFTVRPAKRALIPAVVHVDGTGRLQTVRREDNPLYWSLIEAFRRRTGLPMMLNTSFNENEPIVNRPEEALDCFLRTSMDVLVLGDQVLLRPSVTDRR